MDGAKAWLENAEIGHNCADSAAQQLDGFTTSGIAKRVGKTKEGRYHIPVICYST